MKRSCLIILFVLISSGHSYAQCNEIETEQVMLIGDSWASMMGTDDVFNTVFDLWGHSDKTFYTNAILAENGTLTTDFIQPNRLFEIQNQLLARPSINFVHISLGGNDVLGEWKKTWSQAKTDSLLDSVSSRLNFIMDFIKIVRPGIHIVWSGYTYPNFGEIIGDLAPFQTSHPFYPTWNGMGQPTFTELNSLLNYYSSTMENQAMSDPQLDFVNSVGVIQYTFGQAINLTVPPGGSYAAFTAPLPLGFPNYPSPKNAMRNYIIFKDCFHLSTDAFNDFISYQTRKYYHKALMHDQYIISEGGTRDGSVTSSGIVSNSLLLGSSAGDDYSMVLSFNTTTMPDTGVSAAAIFLRRETLTGINPISSTMTLNVVNGNFGSTVDVEVSDFGDPGNETGTPCQFGTAGSDGGWIRLEIPGTLLPYINFNATTQFALTAPGASGLVSFSNASDPELAPVLDITYGPQPTGLAESIITNADILVYPNPANEQIYFSGRIQHFQEVVVFDLMGKIVINKLLTENKLDISSLTSGVYFVRIYDGKGNSFLHKIVKN